MESPIDLHLPKGENDRSSRSYRSLQLQRELHIAEVSAGHTAPEPPSILAEAQPILRALNNSHYDIPLLKDVVDVALLHSTVLLKRNQSSHKVRQSTYSVKVDLICTLFQCADFGFS